MEFADITQEDFQAYEEVRQSGATNMLSPEIQELAGISREAHVAIIKHYGKLCAKWPTIRDLS